MKEFTYNNVTQLTLDTCHFYIYILHDYVRSENICLFAESVYARIGDHKSKMFENYLICPKKQEGKKC